MGLAREGRSMGVQSNDTTTTTTTIEKHEATKTQKYDNNVHDTT
jgi:hypothetical protein